MSGWQKIIRAVTDNSLSTDPFHISLLANILRRPIMVFGKDHFNGFYLPSLWPESFVIKSPLVVGRTSDFIPLISHLPESGRDFIPIETADGELIPICSVTNAEAIHSDELLSRYLDIQEQALLVNHHLVTLQLAKLNCVEMTYDMSIIDQYLDGISGTQMDMETYVLSDRWSQLAIGFPPMDWYLPKQVSLCSFAENHHHPEQQDYDEPMDDNRAVVRSSSNEDFFNRETVEISAKTLVEEPNKPEKPEVHAKRAMFKRRGTLSDMGPAFGGLRGIMIGGELDDSSTDASAPVRKAGPIAARPGLGTRVRPPRKTSLPVDTISEEEAEPQDPLMKKLNAKYKAPELPEQHQGFIVDRSAFRTMVSNRRTSLSDTLPQFRQR